MAKVRVFEAATEGFRLIRREPKAVLVWSAVLFLILGLPAVLLMQIMTPMLLDMSQAGIDGSTEELFATQARILGLAPLIGLLAILAYVVIGGAVLRAVISPEDRRFFYMRVGKSEQWLVLSAIVGFILFYIALVLIVMVLALILAIPFALIGDEPGFSGAHWGIVLGIIGGYVAGIYVMFRFSMAPIMSFEQARFRLFESWRFTRGNGWRLFGLALLISLAILVVELVIMLVFFAGMAPTLLQMGSDPMAALAFERQILAFYGSPMMWPAALLGALFGGAYMALMFAPWASVYEMLKGESAGAGADAVPSEV